MKPRLIEVGPGRWWVEVMEISMSGYEQWTRRGQVLIDGDRWRALRATGRCGDWALGDDGVPFALFDDAVRSLCGAGR